MLTSDPIVLIVALLFAVVGSGCGVVLALIHSVYREVMR